MNYDHAYHAGNLADVFKHMALTLALQCLQRKDNGLAYIDTHAGAGSYALKQGGEHEQGIGLLWSGQRDWPAAGPYFDIVQQVNQGKPLFRYPGSPLLAKHLMRPQDRMVLFETQPAVCQALTRHVGDGKSVQIRQEDGYRGLLGQIPPPEKRGLILIDPPFEAKNEFERMTETLSQAWRKWPKGVYLGWYPIKARGIVAAFHRRLREQGLPVTVLELLNRPEDKAERLNGSGLVIINPPWQLLDQLLPLLASIAPHCADPKTGGQWALRVDGWS